MNVFWDIVAVLLWSICLTGCAQPGAVRVEAGAVQGIVFDANSQAFKDAVKVALLSPEVHGELTLALSNHVGQMVAQAKAELSAAIKIVNDLALELRLNLQSIRTTAVVTTQPVSLQDQGDTGGNKTNVQAPATLIGSDWAFVVFGGIYLASRMLERIFARTGKAVVRRIRRGT